MRSLQQKLTKPVQFSFINGEHLAFKYSLGDAQKVTTTNQGTWASALGGKTFQLTRNTDTVICDVYGKGVIAGIVLPQIGDGTGVYPPVALVNPAGGDYQITLELDGKIYTITNPSTADYGGNYTMNRAAHFFNVPWLYHDTGRAMNIDAIMASGGGLMFKSHLKVTVNYPSTLNFSNSTYRWGVVMYELFDSLPWGYLQEYNI